MRTKIFLGNIIFIFITGLHISTSAAKLKKPAPIPLGEKALAEINESLHPSKPTHIPAENTGLLHVTSLENLIEPPQVRFPVGLSLSVENLKGSLKNKKNSELNLGKKPHSLMLHFVLSYIKNQISHLSLHFGYQQARQDLSSNEAVLLSKSQVHLTGYRSFYQNKDLNFSSLYELGILQLQVTSSDNELLSSNDHLFFAGIGAQGNYSLNSQMQINADLSLRKSVLGIPQVQIEPIVLSLGATFLW